jgi:hypothetical protein
MLARLLAAAGAAALLLAAPAAADTTTILAPPAPAPVTIPGAGLQRGDALTDGQLLLRRVVAVRAPRVRSATLRCPAGTRHAGLGVLPDARVGFSVIGRGSYLGRQTVRVRAFAAPRTPRGKLVRASIFALCAPPHEGV